MFKNTTLLMRNLAKALGPLLVVFALVSVESALAEAKSCADVFIKGASRSSVTSLNSKEARREVRRSYRVYQETLGLKQKWQARKSHIESIDSFLKEFESTRDLRLENAISDPVFSEFLVRLITKPDVLPTNAELRLFENAEPSVNLLRRKAYNAVLASRDLIGQGISSIKYVLSFWQAEARVSEFAHEKTVLGKLRAALISLWTPVRFFIPFEVPALSSPTRKIFLKQWRSGSYTPTEKEWQILEEYNAKEVFKTKQAFMDKHPTWSWLRRMLTGARKIANTAILALALNHAYVVSENTISGKEYLTDRQYRPAESQVQLIVDVVPFPHLALRIGDKVYSYGTEFLTSKDVVSYVEAKNIRELMQQKGLLQEAAQEKSEDTGSITSSIEAGKALGSKLTSPIMAELSKLPRSVHVVTLNLTPEKVENIKSELTRSVGKDYYNITLANDCATMIARVLEKEANVDINYLIDASPGLITMYFSGLKSSGSTLVESVRQVDVEAHERRMHHLLRNTYYNVIEGKLWSSFFVYNQGYRAYIELTKGPEELQWYRPEVVEGMKQWKESAQAIVDAEPRLIMFDLRVKRYVDSHAGSADKQRLLEQIKLEINEQLELIRSERLSKNWDLEGVVILEYREQVLKEKLENYEALLGR